MLLTDVGFGEAEARQVCSVITWHTLTRRITARVSRSKALLA